MKELSTREFPVVVVDAIGDDGCLQVISDLCRERGWRMVSLQLCYDVFPQNCNIIGAITGLPADHPKSAFSEHMDLPLVRLGALPHPSDRDVPAVVRDYEAIGRMAADHFINRRLKHLAYVGHTSSWRSEILYESFELFAKKHGASCELLHFRNEGAALYEKRYQLRAARLKEWLSSLPKPVGIFTLDDRVASFVATICQSCGLTVPEDVAILGQGNAGLQCEAGLIPISSIDEAREIQARETVALLHRLIQGCDITESPICIAPAGVVQRESTDLLAVSDALVAKALRFIWDNLEQQLSIDEIARECGVSRSILDHAFKRHLGRSPNAERHRKRLERCAELLRSTDLTVAEITGHIGISSLSYLHRSFKKAYGTTLRDYRAG